MVIEGCNALIIGAHSCKFSRGWLVAVNFLVIVGWFNAKRGAECV